MKFSVVVPLYDKARYVRVAVLSALRQSYPAYEVIVVDDGSTDGGAELLRDIDDPRLIVVRQANAGVSAARNRGIALARGNWIVFLDADDWQHPDLLRGLAQAHHAFPQAGMLGADFRSLPDGDAVYPVHWPALPSRLEFELVTDLWVRWMQGTPFATSSVAVRAALLRELQPCFRPGETQGEDLDLWFRVAERVPVALVKAPLAGYRASAQGLSAHAGRCDEPPYLARIRQRAVQGAIDPMLRASATWFVGQQQVTLARAAVGSGRRLRALALLWRARGVSWTLRWQVSLLMTLCVPAKVADRWQASRLRGGARRAPATASEIGAEQLQQALR
jgi:hypothetical protein